MSDLFAVIRERRQMNVGQALALLDAVPEADDETKRSLLSMAGRYLTDQAVIGRWVELTATETDPDLRETMLARIAGCDSRQIPDMAAYIRLMVDCLAEPRSRTMTVASLSRIVTAYPEVVDALAQAFASQSSAEARRQILLALCGFHTLPAVLVDFLLPETERCAADVKLVLVDRLLRRDAVREEVLVRWLTATEPSAVKERVLQHLLDRSIILEESTIGVLRAESRPGVRLLALRALSMQSTRSATAVRAIVQALREDPDAGVRAEAALALQQTVEPTPEILGVLLQTMREEKSRDVARLILAALIPYASTSTAVRDGLLAFAETNLHVEVASVVYEALGRVLLWDTTRLPNMLALYERSQDDRVRSLLLEALSRWPDADERLIRLYRDALVAPDVRIRQWGVLGLLRIPMSEDQMETVASGVSSLLDPSIDRYLRRSLALKIGCIPDPWPELRAALEETAARCDEEEIRQTCRRALARPSANSDSATEDLERWYRQLSVEHEVHGIFPDIYGLFEAYPEACVRVLKVAVLDPACREKLYYNDFRVGDSSILQFLLSHDALDDDLCRYCLEQALVSQGQAFYVGLLRSRPDFPELRIAVWNLLERAASSSESSRVMLLDLMIQVYGSEAIVAGMLRERLRQLSHPAAAIPYLRFLADNRGWGPVKALLAELIDGKSLVDANNLEILRDCIRELFPDLNPELLEPGLADD